VLDDEPKLFFWQREHSRQVDLVAMIEPEAFLFTDDLSHCGLVFTQISTWLRRKWLWKRPYINLRLTLVSIFKALFADDFSGAFVPYLLNLKLLALEVE